MGTGLQGWKGASTPLSVGCRAAGAGENLLACPTAALGLGNLIPAVTARLKGASPERLRAGRELQVCRICLLCSQAVPGKDIRSLKTPRRHLIDELSKTVHGVM